MPGSDIHTDRLAQAERLTAAVLEAGTIALRLFHRRDTIKSWTKEKNSPVCEADIAVNDLLQEQLARPASAGCQRKALTIPHGSRRATSGWSIQSTARALFSPGCPDWTIATALVENGRPVVAAVFAPVS